MESKNSKKLQKIVGEVITCKTPKTIRIKVSIFKVHSKYKKRYLVTKKYVAHDEDGLCKVGDTVEIIPSKPYSKTKRFVVVKSRIPRGSSNADADQNADLRKDQRNRSA